MIINDLDGYYIVFDTKNWNTELDTLIVRNNKKIYITRSSLVVWALHNHPQRILQLSIGRRLPIEAQDAII